ncbi:unnamed protein product [Microthlaspi erraticum]|uniref:F-box associated beta-propeller type 1 domain-containing protein n=1 Tax=Microthlaspi erraticum TaxID=1685480 RepID=A0A6D2IA24_9BRAS|nr:unnamed protein product [Microthlaspi erraticum]
MNLHRFIPVEVARDLRSRLDQIKIDRVFHCDGLLLCVTYEDNPRLVVWNPFTIQTRWINDHKKYTSFALGSSNNNSYKILGYSGGNYPGFGIYDMKSCYWRILDVTLDFQLVSIH